MNLRKILLIFFILFSTIYKWHSDVFAEVPDCNGKCLVPLIGLINDGLSTVESPIIENQCSDFNVMTGREVKCPEHRLNILKRNRGSWYDTVRSANSTCNISTDDPNFRLPENLSNYRQLESFFSKNKNTSIGISSSLISQCLQSVEKKYGAEELNAFVSDYYWSMNRLKKGALGSIEALQGIDHLLETDKDKDDFWKDEKTCSVAAFKETKAACDMYKKCASPPNSMKNYIEASYDKIIEYFAIKKEKDSIREMSCYGRTVAKNCNGLKSAQEKKLESLNKVLEIYEGNLPFLKGDVFNSNINANKLPTVGDLEKALSAQLKTDRQVHIDNLESFKKASECLTSSSSNSTCSDLPKTLAKAPEFNYPIAELEASKEEKKESIIINHEIKTAQCLSESRDLNKEGNSIIYGTAAQIALTVATAGVGGPALAFARGSSMLQKAISAGQQIGAYTLKMAATPTGLLKLSALATSGMSDLYINGPQDFRSLIDSCSYDLPSASQSEESKNELSCSAAEAKSAKFASANREFSDCALSAAMASLNVLPFLPTAVKLGRAAKLKAFEKVGEINSRRLVKNSNATLVTKELIEKNSTLADSIRFKKLQERLNKSLDPDLEEAILKSHHSEGQVFQLTPQEIKAKRKILEDANEDLKKRLIAQGKTPKEIEELVLSKEDIRVGFEEGYFGFFDGLFKAKASDRPQLFSATGELNGQKTSLVAIEASTRHQKLSKATHVVRNLNELGIKSNAGYEKLIEEKLLDKLFPVELFPKGSVNLEKGKIVFKHELIKASPEQVEGIVKKITKTIDDSYYGDKNPLSFYDELFKVFNLKDETLLKSIKREIIGDITIPSRVGWEEAATREALEQVGVSPVWNSTTQSFSVSKEIWPDSELDNAFFANRRVAEKTAERSPATNLLKTDSSREIQETFVRSAYSYQAVKLRLPDKLKTFVPDVFDRNLYKLDDVLPQKGFEKIVFADSKFTNGGQIERTAYRNVELGVSYLEVTEKATGKVLSVEVTMSRADKGVSFFSYEDGKLSNKFKLNPNTKEQDVGFGCMQCHAGKLPSGKIISGHAPLGTIMNTSPTTHPDVQKLELSRSTGPKVP